MITKFSTIILVFLLLGCNHQEDTTDTTNQDILDAFSSGTRTPKGFYTEDIPNDTFYTRQHIKYNGYEVSATTYEEAVQWDNTSQGQLIDISETPWYYQFSHVGPAPSFIDIYRVFKANIIDRTNAVLNCDNCYQGKVNPQWSNPTNIKQLIEYMWQFTLANNRNNVVISSIINIEQDNYVLMMKTAKLQQNVVTVYLITYTVDKSTGIILKSTEQLYNFKENT